jgi:hypothetical protein
VGSNPTSTANAPTTGVSAHPGGARCAIRIRNQPGFRSVLLEPQSTAFFLLLIGVFAALVWWLVVAGYRAGATCGSAEFEDAHVQHGPLVQRRPQRPVQAVFEVEVAFPAHHVREQIAVER